MQLVVNKWGLRREHSFSVELHTTVFQADRYAIKAYVMENPQKGYRLETSTFFLTVRQLSRPLCSQINSKFAWECHQSLVKLAQHTRIKLISSPKTHGN